MHDPFYILAGWLIDGTGEAARSDVLVQIEGGKLKSIKKVRPDDLKPIEKELIDLTHCTLIPGLVDCHVHMTMSGKNEQDLRQHQLQFSFEEAACSISDHIRKQIDHGVLAVRDGGDSAAHTLRYQIEHLQARIEEHPFILKTAGKAWRSKGRYGRLIGRPPEEGFSLAQCIARQEERADHVKIINSGLNSLTQFAKETSTQFSQEDLTAAVAAAHKRNQKVMVHANGRLPVRLAVEAGCNSIEHGYFMGLENLERMAELQIFWAPTAFPMKAYGEQLDPATVEADISAKNLEHQLGQIARARELGVPVVVGTDSGGLGIRHGRAFSKELKLLIEGGFSILEAIRCATFEGARLLGIEERLGRLIKGMPATFIAVCGSPSLLPDALSEPERVYVEGKLISQGPSKRTASCDALSMKN